jgi:hypothetical protein
MKSKKFDRYTLEFVQNEIVKLEILNWNQYKNETEYSMGENMGDRNCARILSDILNNKELYE